MVAVMECGLENLRSMAGSCVVLIFPKNQLELLEEIAQKKVCGLNIISWMAKT